MNKTLISSAMLALTCSAATFAADQPLKAVGVSMSNILIPVDLITGDNVKDYNRWVTK